MQIVICDDIAEDRATLREHIHYYAMEMSLDYVIEEFENAESLINAFHSKRVMPNILFMDIYMNGMNGIDAVNQLILEGYGGSVIFITTSKNHAVQSYEMMADGYLVKPYEKESFRRNFERVVNRYVESFKTISFLCDRLEFSVFLKDLEYVESYKRGSLLHSKGESIKTSKSVSEFEKELINEGNFLRTHQGCLVNLNFIEKIEDSCVLMKSGSRTPLALRNRQFVRKAVADYFFLKMRG